MYQDFFGLKEPPFNLTPDPRFLYMSRRHKDALGSLVYGIKEAKGFIVLTGEIGSGKTTLCRAFLSELNPENTHVALILNSYLSDLELLQAINDELRLPSDSASKKELIDHLNGFLIEENKNDKTTVLIIDESQNLGVQTLEQIRMLSNLETERSKLIQIVLIGQPELAGVLARPELEQLNQRITVRCHIGPLNRDEIYNYVRHRLHVAGAEINITLTNTAINRIFHFSGGVPRKINLVCDRALLAAYAAGTFQIDAKIIAQAEQDLGPLAETASGPARVFSSPGWRAARWVAATLCLCVVLLGLFWAGLTMTRQRYRQGDPGATPTSDTDKPRGATSQVRRAPDGAVAAVPLPGQVDVQPSANQQWYYDGNDVVRIQDPDFSRVACLLTLARRWQFPVALEDFRQQDRKKILRLDVLGIFADKVSLRHVESEKPLAELLPLNLPMMLTLDLPGGELSPYGVLLSADGDACRMADPRVGMVEMTPADLGEITKGAVILYLDPAGLAGLAPGDRSPGVEALQSFLIKQGLLEGDPTKIFDEPTVEALKAWQAKAGLPKTGRMDGLTAAGVAAAMRTDAPSLKP